MLHKNTLQQNKEPKAVIRLSELNVAFIPDKTPHQNSLQLSWLRDGTTRHVFVHHDDPQTIVTWYMAIRCAKLHLLQVAYPSAQDDEVRLFAYRISCTAAYIAEPLLTKRKIKFVK